ncbi:MAG: hypothetical protein ABW061_03080 [Polyangiaceae bacterium]
MFTCERCGAVLPPDRDQCAYCGTVSAAARGAVQAAAAAQAAEQARHAAQVAIVRQTLLSTTEQAASKALMWGLLSFAFFCLPIFNVLSLVQFKRAQASAREAGVAVPTRATVGLICSIITAFCCVGSWVWLVTDIRADNARVEARKVALAKQIEAHPASPVLDHAFACALAEQYLLTNGYQGETNTGAFRDLDCAGAVTVLGLRAEMPDFKLKTSSSGPQQSATVCFKKGERWFVERAQTTGCDLNGVSAAPSASAH